ncbi:hypothetical protein [Pandoraea apista]|uniref:Uncharacterized protein n=1 Tax=Pandoraea apista TaxID=93218 RepID=A0A0B5FBX1_9BURK|nr:hypothetical protein [Pandoraea apista]AJE98276.1 hypothetical protein SG18_08925 [Pandoraea apista]AKH72324.1 hypothetical protein XM39_09125 [Pandoraea apista]AKI60715.1 hypothetical protein AA956_01380 [Pandoraea apista]ALS66242.1 hypothetical protein AT395_15750 [Pandoraea apista]AVF38879.1 hypothetical protein AL486_03435 [Pandoraea apista]
MTHPSFVRSARNTSPLRQWLWAVLPGAIVAVLVLAPHAHAQNTPAPANPGNAAAAAGTAGAAGSGAFNPSADISRAVSRDTTDTAIQNNWNSIMRPPVQAKSDDKPAETPRRGRRGITPGISTN